jgi:hypothetical protein
MRAGRCVLFFAVAAITLLRVEVARADIYGKIRGTVSDPSGAVVPKATIVARNVATGIATQTVSGQDGNYEFLQLATPATYNLSAEASGFKKVEISGIQLSLNQIFVENIRLELGAVTESVSVTEQAIAQVEVTSIELGTTINGTTIANTPLNGRNVVDLMQLQPGIVAASDGRGGSGFGNFASNGSQAEQDSYLLNGIDNNELTLNTILINPSPDAVSEFKLITNTINPEYGRNSGAVVNMEIKSGSNLWHGSAFDFYRDNFLNSRNYFRPNVPFAFHRNQFGATIGGPIRKDHTFFFFSYAGTRESRPEDTGDCGCGSPGTVNTLTTAQLSGSFPDIANSSNVSPIPLMGGPSGTTSFPAGTAYSTIFPTGQIPASDFNSVSSNLLKFIPSTPGGVFTFSPTRRLLDDQFIARFDQAFSAMDSIWGYVLWERIPSTQDLPFTGATLPGFSETDKQHNQQYGATWNHTFNSTTLNEARVAYTRFNFVAVNPTNPVAPSSVGFQINPQLTSGEGLPVVNLGAAGQGGGLDLGFSSNGPQPRIDQVYQLTESFSKIVGKHSLKLGFDMRRFQVFNPFAHNNDGVFDFFGTGPFSTGDIGADFILGFPSVYFQGSGDYADARTREYYSYFQDQWKIRSNLTITFGTGWSVDTPLADIAHHNNAGVAFRPGQQSTVFPTAPTGYVFQGDSGVQAFGTTKWKHFGPRFGFAYSPNWGWLTGGPGKTSIRGGYGIYYNRFNEELATQTQSSPPFALNSNGAADLGGSPSFANPFSGWVLNPTTPGSNCTTTVNPPPIGAQTVCPVSGVNRFPYAPSAAPVFNPPPLSVSVYDPNITIPYAMNYNLTIQRQFGSNTVVSVGYVGAEARHLLLTIELNPGINPAGCAKIPTCVKTLDDPTQFAGNYKYPGNQFASIGDVTTSGSSNYNSLQVSVNRNLSHGLQFGVAYTYSHALDLASGFENSGFGGGGFGGFGALRSTNPFNPRVDYGNSNYDARHRLVISYYYEIPSVRHFRAFQWMPSRITEGWHIGGLTTFQSGFPLDVVDSALPSLTASPLVYYFGNGASWDVPNSAGPIQYLDIRTPRCLSAAGVLQPATGPTCPGGGQPQHYLFDVSQTPAGCATGTPPCQIGAFSAPTIGTEGNAGRDIIHGPGLYDFDFQLAKETKITERAAVQLRIEFFNIFNHTQFDPGGIVTDFNSSAFGTVSAAHDPRIIQLAARFNF